MGEHDIDPQILETSVNMLKSILSARIKQTTKNGEIANMLSKLGGNVDRLRHVLYCASRKRDIGLKSSEAVVIAQSAHKGYQNIFELYESSIELTNTNTNDWIYFNITNPSSIDRYYFFSCMYKVPDGEHTKAVSNSYRMNEDGTWAHAHDPYKSFGWIAPGESISIIFSFVPLCPISDTRSNESIIRKFYRLICIDTQRVTNEYVESTLIAKDTTETIRRNDLMSADNENNMVKASTLSQLILRLKSSALNIELPPVYCPSSTLPIVFMANISVDQAKSSDKSYWSVPISDLYRKKSIGSGSFGTVFNASIRGLCCAVKYWQEIKEDYYRERSVLTEIKHDNLIPFIGANECEKSNYAFIALKLANQGDLHSYYTGECYSFKQSIQIAYELANALHCLHSSLYIHGDIKSHNILMDEGSVKLADFGSTGLIENIRESTCMMGTMHCVAPEVMESRPRYSFACDIFSFGIVMYELAARQVCPRTYSNARNGCVPTIPEKFSKENRQYESLYNRCIQLRPELRPSSLDLVVELWCMQRFAPVQTISESNTKIAIGDVETLLFTPPKRIAKKYKRSTPKFPPQ